MISKMSEEQKDDLREEWKEWSQEKVTKLFLEYLKDFREELVKEWSDLFESEGIISENKEFIVRESGKCEMLRDISDVNFEDIESFYEEIDDVETSMGKGVSPS